MVQYGPGYWQGGSGASVWKGRSSLYQRLYASSVCRTFTFTKNLNNTLEERNILSSSLNDVLKCSFSPNCYVLSFTLTFSWLFFNFLFSLLFSWRTGQLIVLALAQCPLRKALIGLKHIFLPLDRALIPLCLPVASADPHHTNIHTPPTAPSQFTI